ncbi:FAD-binding oxidoreductase [Halofilum ochraceum]|uniref:FAD-binding oxidoreductase n=1 Tax=Halofilum ochraceum TaxID=1611323 RepID=UPI0008DA94E6|nr:FAD-binding oxidoreductase [Halofilum ochraceum]
MTGHSQRKPPEAAWFTATVVGARRIAPAVMSVEIRVETESPFAYCEGQYIRIQLADGRRRDLSIANAHDRENLLEMWVRDVGGDFSRHVFDRLVTGEQWDFEGPLGDAWVRDDDRPLLLVTGGTGLGPARAIVRAELARDPSRTIDLVHGDERREDLFAHEELEHWSREHPSFGYRPTLRVPDAEWEGATGTPDQLIDQQQWDVHDRVAHLFGPPPMVEAAIQVLRKQGIDASDIHADAFTPGATDLDYRYPPGR